MPNEIEIRKKLAMNLEILESGLILIKEEYYVPNPLGSRGYIDILARDAYGNRVIIELKRSDKAARETITELCKYVSLFKSKTGIPDDKIRLFIVSTHWHELTIPYATFSEISPWVVDGYKIKVDKEAKIVNVSKVDKNHNPTDDQMPKIHSTHSIYLFRTRSNRNKGNKDFKKLMRKLGVLDYCLVEMDYSGTSQNVIYPYGLYMAMAKIDKINVEKLSDELVSVVNYAIHHSESIEDHIQALINGKAYDFSDDIEAGYPEKFVSTEHNWKLEKTYRFGRLGLNEQLSESELIDAIRGLSGENQYTYHKVSNPKFVETWYRDIAEILQAVEYMPPWKSALEWFTSDILSTDSMVSVSLYTGQNLFIDFVNFFELRSIQQFACFEATITLPNSTTRALIGYIGWDRKTYPQNPERIFTDIYREPFDFMLSKDDPIIQNHLMQMHGLTYSVVEIEFSPESTDITEKHELQIKPNGDVRRTTKDIDLSETSVLAFIEQNQQYVSELLSYIHTVIQWVN